MTRLLAAIALILTLCLPALTATAQSTGDGDCMRWAEEINFPRGSYRMAQLGCTDSETPGIYEIAPGSCARIARQGARAGLRGHAVVEYVETRGPLHDPPLYCYWWVEERMYSVLQGTW